MGVGIIAMFIGGGWKVDVVSRSASTRDGLAAATAKALAGMGKPTDTSGLKTFATLPEADWSKIDVAVETVTEDLALKQKLFAEMEALARPDCALTSNSSSFPISEIGKGLKTQSRMMGLHFFMPAHLIPLVEVVSSVHTDPKEAERVGAIMKELGKRPVQVRKDVIGFLGNRIQGALMREALWLIEQGVASPEDVDATVRLSLRLPLRRGRPDRAEGAFRLGHDLRGRQDHLARSHQRRRPAADPAEERRRGPHRLQDQARLLRVERRVHSKRARPI